MDKPRPSVGETFTRKVLIPYWFEIVSGIFVGLSMVLIFARKLPIG
ncbi:MAG: hypothetical protein KGI25_01705 [Thaumarchaeota archaeon]|nr:hypothetical protein [Nitrososphaerota archaeon]